MATFGMLMRRPVGLAWAVGLATVIVPLASPSANPRAEGPELGRPATTEEIERADLDSSPDGRGLPPGRGSAREGKGIYLTNCARCHGVDGQGGPADRLVGGVGSLTTASPVKTVGSYWPYATTLFDYIRRAMPYDRPASLSSDEVYAVSAYLLMLNGIVPEDLELTRETLPRVEMPNRDGFIPRP